MKEPWNIKQDDTRTSDSLRIFIIFCEDEVSEPIYFKFFETELIKVNPIEGQKSKIENVIKAITHCLSQDVMEYGDGGIPKLKKEDTNIWCVFDRDVEEVLEKQLVGDTMFNESIETAERVGIKVAWSNDAFELWILLHFEDIPLEILATKNRQFYYNRLSEIFNELPDPNEDLIKLKAHGLIDYKRDMKRAANFRNIVRLEIVGKTDVAIARAKALELIFTTTPATPNHARTPCTLVHLLVEELLKFGGKKYP